MQKILAGMAIMATLATPTHQKDCRISDTWPFEQYGILLFSANPPSFIYPPASNPPNDRNITIKSGRTIIISCNGGRFWANGGYMDTTTRTLLTTCSQDGRWETHDTFLQPEMIRCYSDNPIQVRSEPKTIDDLQTIQAGVVIGKNIDFMPLLEIIFDLTTRNPLYVALNLTRSIGSIKSYLATATALDGAYYQLDGLNFTEIYDMEYQRARINALVGLEDDSDKYVRYNSCRPNPGVSTPGYCFTQRKLAYKGFFVFITQQAATFRYLNIVPQWSFIDYNLDAIERNIFDFATTIKTDLRVYSGTYGVATLPHEVTNRRVELFLYGRNNVSAIPVPLIIWKLVYDPLTLSATGLLTVNDPWIVEGDRGVICEDVSAEVVWAKWKSRENGTWGYSYACRYGDMKRVIGYLPDLKVEGLLV